MPHRAAPRWPHDQWPAADLASDVNQQTVRSVLAEFGQTPADMGVTLAVAVVHRGHLVTEYYDADTTPDSTLISWSMAKSITQAVFGMLVGDGLVDLDASAAVPEFAGTDKADITVRQLLEMRSGLAFVEDYVDDVTSDCLEMLFGSGAADHAHYAASRPLQHQPGTVFNYSSGTTNILARLAGDIIGGGEAGIRTFLQKRLFGPLGMSSAAPKFDQVGTFVGSSYVYATARDFARFGYLYLRDGVWQDQRLLPAGWVEETRRVVSIDTDPPHFGYGQHWWIWPGQPHSMAAHGYEGQYVVVVPQRDLVVVHLGKVPVDVRPPLLDKLTRLVEAFPLEEMSTVLA